MMRIVIGILLYLLIALLVIVGWLYWIQPGMIFYPYRTLQATPADWGLVYEDVTLRTEDSVNLHGWYLPYAGAQRVLLFLHGNAGNISHRRDSLAIFHRLRLNVLIIDYRGYGRSDGKPAEKGLYRDARAAWRHLTEERGFDAQDILLFGRSLGGAVAARLAAEAGPGGLILESTFSSARDFARRVLPLMSRLTRLRFEFNTAAALARVHCPLLVMHSPDDEIMPYELGRKVFAAANEPKQFWQMRGDHNSGFLLSQPGYEQALATFLEYDQPDAIAPIF
ncbi:MAG: alpha/beta hydrolase [Candidatus Thiodiazotropha sp.]